MKIVFVSGYFNPLHGGHLDMIEEASKLGDKLVVIVNNDKAQKIKKGKVILNQENRMRLVRALRDVDEVLLSVDTDLFQIETMKLIAEKYKGNELIFANGGGDRSKPEEVPETEVCKKHGIEMVYGIGGTNKHDSSTRINRETGHETKK